MKSKVWGWIFVGCLGVMLCLAIVFSSQDTTCVYGEVVVNWREVKTNGRVSVNTFCFNGYRFLALTTKPGCHVSITQIIGNGGPVLCEDSWLPLDGWGIDGSEM